tara:strand:+ start:192 stop:368 length:177 start_codon:yes stop_codon:yes gene_type:complete
MALLRFLTSLAAFIGALATAAAMVATVVLIVKSPAALAALALGCFLFDLLLRRFAVLC